MKSFKVFAYLEFIIFIIAILLYLIFPYHPWSILKPDVTETIFVFQIIGGLTCVAGLLTYMGGKGGYFMKMGSDTEVHLLRESHKKAPFRKAMMIMETGGLFLLYYELASIFYITKYGHNAYSRLQTREEIIMHITCILIAEIATFIGYIFYLYYQRQAAYWTIYLNTNAVFANEDEIIETLAKESKKMTIKYRIKQFIKILTFDSKEVRKYLQEKAKEEFNEENEFKARQKALEEIKQKNIQKYLDAQKAEMDKWGN